MWLEKTQVQWVQWVYALWQLIRCNQVALLLLSYVPFMLSQYYRKKAVVVVGSSREYYMQNEEMLDYFEGAPVRLKNIEEISAHREEDKSDLPNWHIVKYNHYYYIAHINALCDLKKCSELFGENIIFVERLLKVSGSIAVGKRLSETEAYEKILSKRYFCSRATSGNALTVLRSMLIIEKACLRSLIIREKEQEVEEKQGSYIWLKQCLCDIVFVNEEKGTCRFGDYHLKN
ncbi:hypothetical protein SUGI_0570520 [Cryptomeria japonica]|nr:hypothetical protein SUGI_0570520 [Cryptomeria japonica]